ncbi:related to carbonyl reductase [Melanopsichium pennsylvanicum]|uniref:Related to carbonyl reductase n=2 Tax=Melanopsichium pennsylvanicum TaxID=63383 RepID=A0AAJ5C6G0_9BASI|nr:related to carbonyl reductase [Melanopsichium pennsylvanicum 4]SNX85454.1 related to carbonyl reductase [Melanopsichium pennsylvanicum]
MASAPPRSVVVTGANKGIGFEAVQQLAQKLSGSIIYLTARSQANGDGAIQKMKDSFPNHNFANVRVLLLEILDSSSIEQAVTKVKEECGTLDVLLHNSGIAQSGGDPGAEQIFDVNVRAAKATIDAFATILTKDTGKVIVVSSEVGTWSTAAMEQKLQDKLLDSKNASWDQVNAWINDWQRYKQGQDGVQESWTPIDPMASSGYGVSKALLNAYLQHYALQSNAPKVAVVCPGYCATELNNWSGPRSAAQGGESVTWPIFNDFKSGHFYQDGIDKPFSAAIPQEFKS